MKAKRLKTKLPAKREAKFTTLRQSGLRVVEATGRRASLRPSPDSAPPLGKRGIVKWLPRGFGRHLLRQSLHECMRSTRIPWRSCGKVRRRPRGRRPGWRSHLADVVVDGVRVPLVAVLVRVHVRHGHVFAAAGSVRAV